MNNEKLKFEEIVKVKSLVLALFIFISAKIMSDGFIYLAIKESFVKFISFNEVHLNRMIVMFLLSLSFDLMTSVKNAQGVRFSIPTLFAFWSYIFLETTHQNTPLTMLDIEIIEHIIKNKMWETPFLSGLVSLLVNASPFLLIIFLFNLKKQ
ncbi:hypothetical protein ACQ9ZH_20995 [Pseudomonas chlororaphis]